MLRDEFLNTHEFVTMQDVRERLKAWKDDYNTERPHGSLGHLTPSEFAQTRSGQLPKWTPVSNSKLTGNGGDVKSTSATRPDSLHQDADEARRGLSVNLRRSPRNRPAIPGFAILRSDKGATPPDVTRRFIGLPDLGSNRDLRIRELQGAPIHTILSEIVCA